MSFPDPIAVFRTEAAELLEQIETGLLDLNHDLSNKDQVDAVFRGLHTLKGSGAMFGFEALAAFTHHCETAFDQVRKGVVPATHDLVTSVLNALDHMRALIEVPAGDHDAVSEHLLSALREAVQRAGSGEAAPAPAPAAPALTHYRLRFSLPRNAMANGTNPLPLLDELRDLGECTIQVDRSEIPSLDALAPCDLYLAWVVELKTAQPRSAIDDVFIFVMDEMQLDVEVLNGSAADAGMAEEPASGAAQNLLQKQLRKHRLHKRRLWPHARHKRASKPRQAKMSAYLRNALTS